MTETLWGVIIGGAVGVVGGMIGTIVQHHYAGKRWKKKAALDRLLRERDSMEKKFSHAVKQVRLMEAGLAPAATDFGELSASMMLHFPKIMPELGPQLTHAIATHSTDPKMFYVLWDKFEGEMRKYLAELDAKIDALLS